MFLKSLLRRFLLFRKRKKRTGREGKRKELEKRTVAGTKVRAFFFISGASASSEEEEVARGMDVFRRRWRRGGTVVGKRGRGRDDDDDDVSVVAGSIIAIADARAVAAALRGRGGADFPPQIGAAWTRIACRR